MYTCKGFLHYCEKILSLHTQNINNESNRSTLFTLTLVCTWREEQTLSMATTTSPFTT